MRFSCCYVVLYVVEMRSVERITDLRRRLRRPGEPRYHRGRGKFNAQAGTVRTIQSATIHIANTCFHVISLKVTAPVSWKKSLENILSKWLSGLAIYCSWSRRTTASW